MTIIAIDTSTQALSLALVSEENGVIGEYKTNVKVTHAVQCLAGVDKLLGQCGINKREITRVVVARGPGSYTGLRIGVTVAKTIAWGLAVDLVGVSSLEVLARLGVNFSGYLLPLIDARRECAYNALFHVHLGQVVRVDSEDQYRSVGEMRTLIGDLHEPVLLIGLSAEDFYNKLVESSDTKGKIRFTPFECGIPSAIALAKLGARKDPVNAFDFVPTYIRMTEAERNLLEKS